MTKYEAFQLVWQGYAAQRTNKLPVGYVWDDLSSMSYKDMGTWLDLLINTEERRLEHRFDDTKQVAVPVLMG